MPIRFFMVFLLQISIDASVIRNTDNTIKADITLPGQNLTQELRDVTCHTGSLTQCYLPPDTSKCAPPNHCHTGWYSIYLPQRDGRL